MFRGKSIALRALAKRVTAANNSHGGARPSSVILNSSEILPQLDKQLGRTRPPAVEYLFVEPYTLTFSFKSFFATLFSNKNNNNNHKASDTSYNPYGHAAIRYTISTGEQFVMNIVGNTSKENYRMVNFMEPEGYLFGDPHIYEALGNEQGGVHLRSIIGIRVEEWPQELIDEMHTYYMQLQRESTPQATTNNTSTNNATNNNNNNNNNANNQQQQQQQQRATFSILWGPL